MQRRKFLVGMGSLAAGGAAAIGTGATDTYELNRDISVSTAGDGSANITLDPNTDSDYVNTNSVGSQGVLNLEFEDINTNGTTSSRPAFTLKNSSDRSVYVWIANPLRNSNLSNKPEDSNNFDYLNLTPPVNGVKGADVQFVAGSSTFMDLSQGGASAESALIDRTTEITNVFGADFNSGISNGTMRTNISDNSYTNYYTSFNSQDDVGYIEVASGESYEVAVRIVVNNDWYQGDLDVDTDYILFASTQESDLSGQGIPEVARSFFQ